MNKRIVGTAVVLIALVALTGATVAFSKAPIDPLGMVTWQNDGDPPCPGGDRGACLIDREKIHAAVANALGISVEEFEAAQMEGKTLADLAEELGIDLEVVKAAMQNARSEVLHQAVDDGRITQEQADQMLSRERGKRFGGRDCGIDGSFGKRGFIGDGSAIAEALGITVEKLEAARAEGKTLAELAEELGIDLEEAKAAMQDAHGEDRLRSGGHNRGKRPFHIP
jgi:DNA-directed RNA polymerase specialized sigma24 family protein